MWREIQIGSAKRVTLEDGTPAVAVLAPSPQGRQCVFFSDVAELERVEFESEKLGVLADLMDVLQPQDIIEICCLLQKN